MKREQVNAVLFAWDERFNWRQMRRVGIRSLNAVRGATPMQCVSVCNTSCGAHRRPW